MINMIGHSNTKRQILVSLKSALKRNKSLPHMLFAGAAGCGKTTMSREISNLCKGKFIPISPDDVKDTKSTAKLMEQLNSNNYDSMGNRKGAITQNILFMDEVHRLSIVGQEPLGIAMEEFRLPLSRTHKYIWLPYFTFIGATTDDGRLSKPFIDRFKLRFLFEPYKIEEMVDMIKMHSDRLGVLITNKGALELAKRSRGVPRIAIRYLESIRDFAIDAGVDIITSRYVVSVFREIGVDEEGLTIADLKLMTRLYDIGSPVGLENLAISINESQKTLSSTIEPFLIQRGLIIRSGRGRILTEEGRKYLEDKGYTEMERSKAVIDSNYIRR